MTIANGDRSTIDWYQCENWFPKFPRGFGRCPELTTHVLVARNETLGVCEGCMRRYKIDTGNRVVAYRILTRKVPTHV